MATTTSYIEYVSKNLEKYGIVRYRKMFGEYMVYINDYPVITVCDNTVFVKKLECLNEYLKNTGFPYEGAKEHFILDIDDESLLDKVIPVLLSVTPKPKPNHSQSLRK